MKMLVSVLMLCSLTACATILNGTTNQDFEFLSNPTNATVIVDGQPRGNTPITIPLTQQQSHVIRMELDGYQPLKAKLTHGQSAGVLKNGVLSGLFRGFAIDSMTGGSYAIHENAVTGMLLPSIPGQLAADEPRANDTKASIAHAVTGIIKGLDVAMTVATVAAFYLGLYAALAAHH
jgi:hypothetical protein